jgi:hypothetical protein
MELKRVIPGSPMGTAEESFKVLDGIFFFLGVYGVDPVRPSQQHFGLSYVVE